ncbi:MAG: membrane lipoprotein lipid attachment site-containing protein [Prevotella sp.]|nr:membrane lipoprotein lipid attachment site-containing protein [Prevotella sp.]MBR3080078.1 membrane lipoprotein lipid attachment site-containing protein [Prevotella sp.]
MKKFIYLLFLTLVLVACSQSQEQKAEALIKESLKMSLYKPETYKPVETKVDSAFAPYDDPAFFEELAELEKMNSEYEELDEKAKRAKSSMAIWSGPYQTAFGRNEYQEAKEDYDEANAQINKLKTKGKKQYEKVVSMLQSERKFIGYKALHNYRADNNAGNTLIGNTIFFINQNFTEVQYSMEAEEYEQVQNAISQFKEQIEETEE